MTNDDTSWDEIDILFGEEFKRPISPETRLKMLHTAACELFGKKYRTTLMDLKEEILNLRQLLDLLAFIISKTYVECGDSFQLADDEALVLIRDQLIQHNPFVIARNKNKRLPKELSLYRMNQELKP